MARLLAGTMTALALAVAPPLAAADDTTDLYSGFTLVDPEAGTSTADAWLVVRDGRFTVSVRGLFPRVTSSGTT